MTKPRGVDLRRRRATRRRLLFCAFLAPLLGLGSFAPAAAQDTTGARILARRARLLRNDTGSLRVIEVLRVALADHAGLDSVSAQPLTLLVLPPDARQVMGVGGDLAPTQLIVEPPRLRVLGPFGGQRFELVVTYLLPANAGSVEFTASLPQDTLLVEIDRATVDARPARALRSVGPGGSDARPLLRYQALSLAPGVATRIEVAGGRLDWQERVAVLIATALAAIVAGVALWRRGGGAATAATTGDGRTDPRY